MPVKPGNLALDRFDKAQTAREPDSKLRDHLNTALAAYREALKLIPNDAVNDLARVHNQLGVRYRKAGDIKCALTHYRKAIHNYERVGNTFAAAQTRYNAARALYRSNRFEDAREYALVALKGFASFGVSAVNDVQDAQELIKEIDTAIAGKKR